MQIGFAGSGNMAAALARGWAALGGPDAMLFSDGGSGRAEALAEETGGERASTLSELGGRSDVVVLAVKPAALDEVAGELRGFAGPVVSVLGATLLRDLHAALPGAQILRTMPNVAVEVGRGVICHAAPADDALPALEPTLGMLARLGTLVELPEEQLDAATAVMGCSPAYIALACEAIAASGAEAGLDRALAAELIARAAWGTGELLLRHQPADLQRAVASPGGSTEAGLEALAERSVADAFSAAVSASLARMAGNR